MMTMMMLYREWILHYSLPGNMVKTTNVLRMKWHMTQKFCLSVAAKWKRSRS